LRMTLLSSGLVPLARRIAMGVPEPAGRRNAAKGQEIRYEAPGESAGYSREVREFRREVREWP